ncbi:hypothetical protein DOTSEDRAFT_32103 [Dothistroma septosporum NZE10]|uniref:Uncharacterized protein n=1 Tax=Dothistroma septosporum (strain NZE10 / CBS 128990) TaxID=675120 RepID=N1PZS6_DOTSN|nr:hypothetical protein DOTSEDRAFT_32103 [Dothistroma septosporum NZE10]
MTTASTGGLLQSTSSCGLHLRINGKTNKTFDHPHIARLPGLSSCFLSRSIRRPAGQPCQLTVTLSPAFKPQQATGIRVTIAIGHRQQDPSDFSNVQSWWIATSELREAHTFEHMQRWNEEDSEVGPVQLQVPKFDWLAEEHSKEVMWQETGIANKGCIAVFMQRGHLSDESAEENSFQPTFPPVSSYHSVESGPRVIRPGWFVPLPGFHGRPTIFELRNLFRSAPETTGDDPDTLGTSGDASDRSDDELRPPIAASKGKSASRVQRPSSSQSAFKLDSEGGVTGKPLSSEHLKHPKSKTDAAPWKRSFQSCWSADDDQDDEEPLPVKNEPGAEEDDDRAMDRKLSVITPLYTNSQMTSKRRRLDKVDEADEMDEELQRRVRESEAEVALAEARRRHSEAEEHLADVRAANEAERERRGQSEYSCIVSNRHEAS